MDPIIAKLNEIAQGKIEKSVKLPDIQNRPGSFQATLDNSLTDRLLEKLRGDYSLDQNQMNVLSADSVHVETKGVETADTKPFSSSEKFFDMFKQVNKDLISLDSTLETITTPGFRPTGLQLLALQAGVGQTTLMAEAFTRLVDVTGRTIQNLTTQVNV